MISPVFLEYHASHIFPRNTELNEHITVELTDEKEVVVERHAVVLPIETGEEELSLLEGILAGKASYFESSVETTQKIMDHEFIPVGLGDYY